VAGCHSDDSKLGGLRTPDAGTEGKDADGGAAPHTSNACGNLHILSDFWAESPASCISCVDDKCCSEASACAADGGCNAYIDCLGRCDQSDESCLNACAAPSGPELNSLYSCQIERCSSCLDVSCAGKSWPSSSASSHHTTLLVENFASSEPIAGVTAKVCDAADLECESPLETGTTASDGTVQLARPAWTARSRSEFWMLRLETAFFRSREV
jgi:hypothetical protein